MSKANETTVTVLIPLLYASGWRERGDVLQMDEGRAKTLQASKHVLLGEHELTDEPPVTSAPAAVFDPEDFPSGEDLAAAGILNVPQLREFITANGDGWFSKVKGVGKGAAAKIAAALQEPTV